MGLTVQRELSEYLWLQRVMELQLFYVNFEQNIEGQHEHALPVGNDTTIISYGVAIRTLVEMDDNR